MLRLRLAHALLLVASLAALAPSPALARARTLGLTEIVEVSGGNLTVASNGRAYSHLVGPAEITVTTSMKLRMNPPHRIVGWSRSTLLTYQRDSDPLPSTRSHGDPSRQTYPVAERPGRVDERLRTIYDTRLLAGPAVELCNDQARELRRRGKSDAEIFGADRQTQIWLHPRATFESTTSGGMVQAEARGRAIIGITCRRSIRTGRVPDPDEALAVTSASIQARPIQRAGERCRIAVQVSIQTNQPGSTIAYRVGTERGTESAVFRVETGRRGGAVQSHMFEAKDQAGRNRGYFWLKPAGETPPFSANKARYDVTCGRVSVERRKPPTKVREILPRGVEKLPRLE